MTDSLSIALQAVEDKKAIDVIVLDISGVASFTDYFLLCSGDSSRQIQAIAEEVEAKLRAAGIRSSHVEGLRNAEWVLLDYADFVVHIFSKKARAFYDLERLWRDGKKLDPKKIIGRSKPQARARIPSKKRKPS